MGIFSSGVLAVLSLLSAIIFIALYFRKRPKPLFYLAIVFCALFIGLGQATLYNASKEKLFSKHLNNEDVIEGTVTSRIFSSDFLSTFEVDLHKIGDETVNMTVVYECDFASDLQPGFLFRTKCSFEQFEATASFDEKQYYNSQNIYLKAVNTGDKIEIISEDDVGFEIFFDKIRLKLTSIYKSCLEEENAQLLSALSLGNKGELNNETKRDFLRCGIYHLLAVSGTHFTILVYAISLVTEKLKVNKKLQIAIIFAFVVFYALLCGATKSVLRSAIMLILLYLSQILREDYDSLTSLTFTVALICFLSPSSIYDTGLTLTFATCFGIIVFAPTISRLTYNLKKGNILGKILAYVIDCLLISFVAVFMSLPLNWAFFGSVSLIGPLATLIELPIVTVLLYLAPILLLTFWIPHVGDIVSLLIDQCCETALLISEYFSSLKNIVVSLKYDFVAVILAITFIVIFVLLLVNLRRKIIFPIIAFLSLLSLTACYYYTFRTDEVKMTYRVIGSNEYFYADFNGKNAIIDISDGSSSKLGEAVYYSYEDGFCELDVYILTHLHQKNVPSFRKLIAKNIVRHVVVPLPINEKEENVFLDLTETAEKEGIEITTYDKNDEFSLFDSVNIKIKRDYIERSTHPIIAIDLSGDISAKYFSSSYLEFDQPSDDAEYLIFGTHGPVSKRSLDLNVKFKKKDKIKVVSFADEEIFEVWHSSLNELSENDTVIIKNTEFINISRSK